ncbi:ISAs1 family transposase [Vibrio aestuarianus]|uniref:ISAs1 family transposase n=1 Tax=Vibrio aestuarianus TaxID=28171 RepID=UPI00237C7D45|nr:ISAs1 family transposase [Vibrio aestuarianus]MDE1311754.1 ISAs1 family transposase [Vibrio aestuarianus]MDE1311975.1 ISAs1 family transposase [Vibrio aestuarianus]
MNYMEFKEHFSILSDTRQERKTTYNFFEVMFQVVTAMLCGMKTWDDIEAFGEENLTWFRKFSGYAHGVPSHDTLARIVGLIDPDEFSLCFVRWCNDIQREKALETHHIAIDGKSLRGTYDYSKNKYLTHMVNAYSVDAGLVLGQLKTDVKSNEITLIPEILKLIKVKGRVISLDAMGCQRSIAKEIVERGGDYLMSVKSNQARLHALFESKFAFDKLAEYAAQAVEQEEVGKRGRKMVRTYITVPFEQKYGDFAVDWKELKTLCIAVTYQKDNHELSGSMGMRYFISSKELTPSGFGQLCRGHWGVESMHWWLDAVMNEDDSRITYKHASENLSRIRQMCMNFIKLVDMKGTLKRRQLKCALNTEFRERVLFGD